MYILTERWNDSNDIFVKLALTEEVAIKYFEMELTDVISNNVEYEDVDVKKIVKECKKGNGEYYFPGYYYFEEELDVSISLKKYEGDWTETL